MADSQTPIYVSRRMAKSLWQEYRVFHDRLELECKVAFKTLIIPAAHLLDVEVRPPLVFADLFRGKGFFYSFPLKTDFADGHSHVAITRSSGLFKHLRITPDDPEKFAEACRGIMLGK